MASGQSPASSPRLPSPPPIAEDQIGPTSPGVSLFEERDAKFPGINSIDTGVSRRIRPGTRAEDMAEGPPLIELQDIDSAFQLTEHLKALHHTLTHPATSSPPTVQPLTAEIARQLTTPPPNTSRDIWLYELARFLIQKTNAIIISLFADDPPCSTQTCPEMRASEWQYLCAVHDPPKSCAAIDYCCHTLDWACNTLASPKNFPSRLGLGSGNSGGGGDKLLQNQLKEIKNIFRRVYRIYAHAWFSHREMFWRVEGRTGLYVFYKMVCDEYNIIEHENYTIPAEAEGLEPQENSVAGMAMFSQQQQQEAPPTLLKKEPAEDRDLTGGGIVPQQQQDVVTGNNVLAMGDTTKRHRHTLSTDLSGSGNIIQEEAEEEEEEEEDDHERQNAIAADGVGTREDVSESHLPPPPPSKPTLDTLDTPTLHNWPEEPDMRTPHQEKEEPVPRMLPRSDTIRAAKDGESEEVGSAGVVGNGDETVVEEGVEVSVVEVGDVGNEEVKGEGEEEEEEEEKGEVQLQVPQNVGVEDFGNVEEEKEDAAAADAEDAGNSIGD